MKQKLLSIKTLLVAAMLGVGVNSAWADEWSVDFKTLGNTFNQDKGAVALSAESVKMISGTDMRTISYNSGTAFNNNFVVGSNTSWLLRNSNRGLYMSQNGTRQIGCLNCTKNQIITLVVINGTPTAVTNVTLKSSGEGTYVFSVNDDGDVKFNVSNYFQISSISIQNPSATSADYTVRYVDEADNELKASATYSGEIDGDATISAIDKADIWVGSVKYVYKEDDADGKTVASDGSTVVTVTFKEGSQFSYTLNAVDADDASVIIKEITHNDAAYEGTTYYERGEKAFYQGGKLYSTTWSGGFEVSFDEAATKTIPYSENTTWAYYTEAEDMTLSGDWAGDGGYPAFYSRGVAKRLGKGAYIYTNPFACGGTYTVTMWARNNSGSQVANIGLYTRDSDGNLTTVGTSFEDWAKGSRIEKSVVDIVIPPGCSFVIKNESNEYTSNLELDYIYFVKTADYTVSKAISNAGWATYCSPYALDLENATGLTDAYIVTGGTGGVLAKTSVKGGTVPANTGLLLKGAEGTVTIPVVVSSTTDVDANKLVGVTTNTAIDAEAGYVLMASPSLGFYKNKNAFTVGANTAYLPAGFATDGTRSFFLLDGETTGVNDVRDKMEDVGSAVYNLNGQRVSQPTKGLYIVNGKKVIVK